MYEVETISNLSLPHKVTIEGDTYYIMKEEDSYRMLSSSCPHQGAKVKFNDDKFSCPVHGWEFDLSGKCVNIKNQSLYSIELVESNGKLLVDLSKLNTVVDRRLKSEKSTSIDIDFKVHAHACLEICHNGFSFLTDPWLDGPAFYGSWAQHPKPKVKIKELMPDVIWITHEHSDHFHINSMEQFDKDIPVYFPNFPNKRIETELIKLGFTNINPVSFGQEYIINDNISIICYEPESVWNDSILHIAVNDFHILNVNDAGVNHKIKKYLPPIDLLCSSFSPGASGYPLCWDVSEEEQKQYYSKVKTGTIEMLRQSMEMYRAKFLLPFASHFRLQHPDHEQFNLNIGKNNIMDVKTNLNEHQVIDLLPGESWNSLTGAFFRVYNEASREKLYKSRKYLFNMDEFSKFYPINKETKKKDVEAYILNLNNSPDIVHCENIQVKINDIDFYVEYGKLYLGKNSETNLYIEVPDEILYHLIRNNVSWDEAHIGYWCRMKRTGEYNQNFWRVLQCPYYMKRSDKVDDNLMNMNVNHLLKNNARVDAILRRYGLYCSSCSASFKENLSQAIKYHGLSDYDSEKLIKELNFVIHNTETSL